MFEELKTHQGPKLKKIKVPSVIPLTPTPPRPAKVISYDFETGKIKIAFLDARDGTQPDASAPCDVDFPSTMPYVGLGWGFYAGIEKGSECLVSYDSYKKPYIVCWRPNPLYFDSERMKSVAKKWKFKFSSNNSPLYPVFRVLKEGDIAMVSRSGAGMVVGDDGSIAFVGGNLQEFQMLSDEKAVFLTTGQFRLWTEAGITNVGAVRRYHLDSTGVEAYDMVTKTASITTGLVDGVSAGAAASQPSPANKVLTEKYEKFVDQADMIIGDPNELISPTLITREINVVADGKILIEKPYNGKVLGLGVTPDAPALPVVLPGLVMWFRKQFQLLAAKWELRINKLGHMQFYSKPPTGDTNVANNGVSINAKMGAIKINIDNSLAPANLAILVEDTTGNKVEIKGTGITVEDALGNKIETSGIQVIVNTHLTVDQ